MKYIIVKTYSLFHFLRIYRIQFLSRWKYMQMHAFKDAKYQLMIKKRGDQEEKDLTSGTGHIASFRRYAMDILTKYESRNQSSSSFQRFSIISATKTAYFIETDLWLNLHYKYKQYKKQENLPTKFPKKKKKKKEMIFNANLLRKMRERWIILYDLFSFIYSVKSHNKKFHIFRYVQFYVTFENLQST